MKRLPPRFDIPHKAVPKVSRNSFNAVELTLMAQIAGAVGVDVERILQGTHHTEASLKESSRPVTLEQHMTALQNGVSHTADCLFALRAGARIKAHNFGLIAYALQSAPTLLDALNTAFRFGNLLSAKCGPTLITNNGTATLYFSVPAGFSIAESALCMEFEMAKIIAFIRDLHIRNFRVSSVRIPFCDAEHLTRACVLLDCQDTQQADVASISFDALWLQCRLPLANPSSHQACLNACQKLLAEHAEPVDIEARVREILMDAPPCIPTLSEVASTLCMSARTLRRRLELSNTSYSQLQDEVMKAWALNYVASTNMTTELIAESLGYSDAASFSHAFKRWTGEAPRQYRTNRGLQNISRLSTARSTSIVHAVAN